MPTTLLEPQIVGPKLSVVSYSIENAATGTNSWISASVTQPATNDQINLHQMDDLRSSGISIVHPGADT
jgi:hypothetical protein